MAMLIWAITGERSSEGKRDVRLGFAGRKEKERESKIGISEGEESSSTCRLNDIVVFVHFKPNKRN